jgi:hypothetical protein
MAANDSEDCYEGEVDFVLSLDEFVLSMAVLQDSGLLGNYVHYLGSDGGYDG